MPHSQLDAIESVRAHQPSKYPVKQEPKMNDKKLNFKIFTAAGTMSEL